MFKFATIRDYHQQLVNGQHTCTQATVHFLQEIQNNKQLNAFIEIYTEDALKFAAILDDEIRKGKILRKLHGVVIGIKDNISYKGHFVSAGSKMLQTYQSVYSATVVERMIQEGAIIIGRQNCDEFAMGNRNENPFYGSVKNALDETRISGGSSGGSAVAVQAGLCMVSLGSDTGGSVRQPADHCGIVGFKPGYGAVSRYGLISYASSFDQIGILANNIEDTKKIFKVISGEDGKDSTMLSNLKNGETKKINTVKTAFKIAYFPETLSHKGLDPEMKSSIENTIDLFRNDGYTVDAIAFPLIDFIVPAYYILTTAEASSNLSRYDGVRFGFRNFGKNISLQDFFAKNRSEGFGWEVKKRIMLGTFVLSAGYHEHYFMKAQQVRKMIIELAGKIFHKYDFIILPTVPAIAGKIGGGKKDITNGYLSDIYTVFANLAGIPAISLPLYKHSSGMVFGIQAMSSPKNELSLLGFSEIILKKYKI
ncbi:MAG: Asp-tRNA(Asn)/Glu-tRNA(Gln) amidotransferase subunit GatA [Chitinophagaceae bacterium]